ncbi:MAG: hypothetical protein PHH16_01100 [Candidatus Gracilibacteria bacterium]|nr:hypothetical protein [Candidatus Gracilibacteria bacterium]
MKKIIGASGALIIAGAGILSSVSATEMESPDGNTTTSSESSGSVETASVSSGSSDSGATVTTSSDSMTGSVDIGDTNNLYEKCLTYVKLQKLEGVDCKAKVQAMQQGIKNDRAQMNQRIKDERMKMQQENMQNRQMMGSGNTMEQNQALRKENQDNRQEFRQGAQEQRQAFRGQVQAKKQALSEKLRGQLIAVVAKLTQENLTKVLANVDKVVMKINASTLAQEKKDHLLAQLEEIRTVIQDKLDALTGTSSEGNILNEVLSGVAPTDSSTGSTASTGTGTTTVIQ